MKITLIGPVYPYRGGIAHFTTMLALKLIEQGHEIQIISFKKQYPKWLYPGKSDKDISDSSLKTTAKYIFSPINFLDWIDTLREIKEFSPEFVIFQWWTTFWALSFGVLSKWLITAGLRTKFIIHNTLPHEPRLIDSILVRFGLNYAEQLIIMNCKEKEVLRKVLRTEKNIVNSQLPVFNFFPEITLSQIEVRNKLGLPLDQKIIIFFGLVRPYKGLKILILAINELIQKGYNLGLLIVGEFWEKKERYIHLIEELDLKTHVWIIDRYVTELETSFFFRASDVFVAPYVGGTQSASVKTAIGFGIPLVISSIISDELIEKIPNCIVIKPNNPIDLSTGILKGINLKTTSKGIIYETNKEIWKELLCSILTMK